MLTGPAIPDNPTILDPLRASRYVRSTLDAGVGVPVAFFEMRILDEQGRKRTPAATCRRLGEQVWYDEGGAHPYSLSSSHHLPPQAASTGHAENLGNANHLSCSTPLRLVTPARPASRARPR
jgi:hypothetical protein